MQHILRCWESQSDGSEYKKTLRRPGLRPRPRWGNLQRSLKPPSWWGRGWLSPPQEPHPQLSALRASPLLPHSKISSDAVDFRWSWSWEFGLVYIIGTTQCRWRGSLGTADSVPSHDHSSVSLHHVGSSRHADAGLQGPEDRLSTAPRHQGQNRNSSRTPPRARYSGES